MSVTLNITNYTSANVKEKTTLDADYIIGSMAMLVTNNQNISNGDFVLLGVSGSEVGEIRTVASVSSATGMTTDATTLYHNRFDPVTVLRGNQIRLYTAPNSDGTQPADSAFSTLVATIPIDPDQLQTSYTHAGGSGAVWYKYTYYNSSNATETDIADSRAVRGGVAGNYASIDDIRDEAGFRNNRNIADSTIDRFRQQAQSAINGALSGLFSLPFASPVNPWISRITEMLAAGYLQIDQYGTTFNINSEGVNNKVAEGLKALEAIKSGQTAITDANGVSTAIPDTNGFSAYPNATTTNVTHGDEDFMFKRSDVSGFAGRKY